MKTSLDVVKELYNIAYCKIKEDNEPDFIISKSMFNNLWDKVIRKIDTCARYDSFVFWLDYNDTNISLLSLLKKSMFIIKDNGAGFMNGHVVPADVYLNIKADFYKVLEDIERVHMAKFSDAAYQGNVELQPDKKEDDAEVKNPDDDLNIDVEHGMTTLRNLVIFVLALLGLACILCGYNGTVNADRRCSSVNPKPRQPSISEQYEKLINEESGTNVVEEAGN